MCEGAAQGAKEVQYHDTLIQISFDEFVYYSYWLSLALVNHPKTVLYSSVLEALLRSCLVETSRLEWISCIHSQKKENKKSQKVKRPLGKLLVNWRSEMLSGCGNIVVHPDGFQVLSPPSLVRSMELSSPWNWKIPQETH